jgi:hypothetical protein
MTISTRLRFNQPARRLSFSVTLSMLLHLLVLFIFQLYLHSQKPLNQPAAMPLSVRLMNLPHTQVIPVKKLLAQNKHATFKVPQTAAPTMPGDTQQQSESIGGIALPGAVASPFSGLKAEGNAFFAERHAQQDAMRAYREQALQMQAQQQAAQQSQLLTLRLQQLLASKLEAGALPPGICTLVEPATNGNHGLACNNNALYTAVANEQREIASLLMALRDQGSVYKGFSAERIADKLSIRLINTP